MMQGTALHDTLLGLNSSIHAAYTKEEIVVILNKTSLKDAIVSKSMIGI